MKTKSFFSDDAIQRIASGNEPTQTLISIDLLKNVLKPHQLRNVLGGSDESESGWCDGLKTCTSKKDCDTLTQNCGLDCKGVKKCY